jgi:hypothetical protein
VLAAGGFESNREWLREAWGQNERGEWPADNFLIRGTRFNQGVLLAHDRGRRRRIGDPTQAHMVAIDARAPLYDGGICTRIDCVSLGVVVNRDAERFYDEGEDFWPKRYAIWGRLVAQQPGQIAYSIIDAKAIGRFMPPVFPGVKADTLPNWRASWAGRGRSSTDHARLQRRLPPGRFDHTVLDDCHTEGLHRPRRTGRARSTRAVLRLRAAPRHDLHLPGPEGQRPRRSAFCRQPSDNLFVAGEMMAGNVLGKGYTAGVGMSIGTAFGRIAGSQAAQAAASPGVPMQELESLAETARRDAQPAARRRHPGRIIPIAVACTRRSRRIEVARQMQICNACRYCEGFCAVFPAMTRRLEFGKADVHYLANLCHNCGACYHACQYAPPHEFAVNVPKAMARVRPTYASYAWPAALGAVSAQRPDRRPGAGRPAWRCSCCWRWRKARWPAAHRRQLLCGVPAQPAGGDVRRRVRPGAAGAGHGRAALLARRLGRPGQWRGGGRSGA